MNTIGTDSVVPHASVIIRLLQGTLFHDEKKSWNDLLSFQGAVRLYFSQIGVSLHLDEKDGFAFLTQAEQELPANGIPRLIKRIPLSYEVTLLLVVLRESLEEFDIKTTDSTRCYISDTEIKEKIEIMYRDKADKVKLLNKFDSYINQAVNLGFLREVNPGEAAVDIRRFEIRRVIRAKINNEKLEEIKEQLNPDE